MSQKKHKVKNLRNVLASPFNIQWSENTSDGAAAALEKALQELLPLAKLEEKNLNLKNKGKRKEKPCVTPTLVKKHYNIFRTYLVPGFQSVIRRLEKNELCCVLLSEDISPPMIQRVVCGYCYTYNVPLMIISKLKTIAKNTLGFPTMVLGFKKSVESHENKFYPIYQIVSQSPCVFERSFILKTRDEKTTLKGDKSSSVSNTSQAVCEASQMSPLMNKDFYLYRENKSERIFRPRTEIGVLGDSKSKCNLPAKDGMVGDFISFGESEVKSSKIQNYDRKISSNVHEDEDSNIDSLDEDNLFFVDDKPDHMLLETEQPVNEVKGPKSNIICKGLDGKSSLCKTKVTFMNHRYFTSKVNQNARKNRKKEKTIKHKNFGKPDSTESKEKCTSAKFQSTKIKTIISNPKKIRRKK